MLDTIEDFKLSQIYIQVLTRSYLQSIDEYYANMKVFGVLKEVKRHMGQPLTKDVGNEITSFAHEDQVRTFGVAQKGAEDQVDSNPRVET